MQNNKHLNSTDIARAFLSNKAFPGFMSQEGRRIFDTVLAYILKYGKEQIEHFSNNYCQVIYEDAVLSWDNKEIIKFIDRKLSRVKNYQECLKLSSLSILFTDECQIKKNTSIQFRFSRSASATEIYNLVTSQYLISDFHKHDLIKLHNIAKTYSIETVKDAINKTDKIDIKNITYLEKVLTYQDRSNTNVNIGNQGLLNKSDLVVNDLVKIQRSSNINIARSTDWIDDLTLARTMEDITQHDE